MPIKLLIKNGVNHHGSQLLVKCRCSSYKTLILSSLLSSGGDIPIKGDYINETLFLYARAPQLFNIMTIRLNDCDCVNAEIQFSDVVDLEGVNSVILSNAIEENSRPSLAHKHSDELLSFEVTPSTGEVVQNVMKMFVFTPDYTEIPHVIDNKDGIGWYSEFYKDPTLKKTVYYNGDSDFDSATFKIASFSRFVDGDFILSGDRSFSCSDVVIRDIVFCLGFPYQKLYRSEGDLSLLPLVYAKYSPEQLSETNVKFMSCLSFFRRVLMLPSSDSATDFKFVSILSNLVN